MPCIVALQGGAIAFRTQFIAHRGNRVDYPENTIEAFRSAIELGAHGIEMDVQVNTKGEAIVVHDYVRPLSDSYPRLTDVLEQFKDKTHLEIEIKSFRLEEVKIITDIIERFNPPKMEITSSIYPILPYIREVLPHATAGVIFADKFIEDWMNEAFMVDLLEGYMELCKAHVLHLPPSIYSAPLIERLKKTYTIHHHLRTADRTAYERLVNLGVDLATFDDIRLLKKI